MEINTCAELATRLQSKVTESGWQNMTLLGVVRLRDSIKSLEALQSLHTTSSLVRNHATDSAIEDLARSALVERTSGRLDVTTLAQEGQVLQLRAMEVAGDIDLLAANHHDLLAQKKLFGNCRRESAENVALESKVYKRTH
jgi:hypothetical protein